MTSAWSSVGAALSASMEIRVDDEYFVFGGPELFCSIPNQEASNFMGLFIVRCFQAVGVHTTREMEGALVKFKLINGKVVGISSLENDNFSIRLMSLRYLKKAKSISTNKLFGA